MHCRQMDLTHSSCLQAHVADRLRCLSNDSHRKEKKKKSNIFYHGAKLSQDNLFFNIVSSAILDA